jgi:hypothetical protein
MRKTALHWLGHSIVVAAAALTAACAADAPSGPGRAVAGPMEVEASIAGADRAPDLGSCDSLAAPAGSRVAFHTFAEGVQLYRWDGASWVFVAPEAVLTADAAGTGVVGTHYAGPTWESNSGSKVVGAVAKRCPAGAANIPWLLLRATSAEGPGIFGRTTFIQRVNTVGGIAPAAPGAAVGETARVPYTAEYVFYR